MFSVSLIDLHITLTHPSGVRGTLAVFERLFAVFKFRFGWMSLFIHHPSRARRTCPQTGRTML